MSKKNRKKKKGKESDGRGSSTGGGGGSNNNNHNNNISIPTMDETVVATTTTSLVTTEYINTFNKEFGLTDYPKSTHYGVGLNYLKVDQGDLAIASFIRGAENDGCVGCMVFYMFFQRFKFFNVHLLFPWALECSIRGHTKSMAVLMFECYEKTEPVTATALSSFWVKTRIESGDTTITKEERKKHKKNVANICYVCEKEDSKDKVFEKCGICKYYSYCGKDCQTYHWKEQNHMAECRHLKILREYCKPRHVKEIREAIINGDDPKEIPRLQNLRTALGLNRPKVEYEELLLRLGDDNGDTIQDRYNYLTARKDGTVHIESTPNVI